jgi:hypothetical protein
MTETTDAELVLSADGRSLQIGGEVLDPAAKVTMSASALALLLVKHVAAATVSERKASSWPDRRSRRRTPPPRQGVPG